ncbi:MAG: hypothetical protein EP343_17755 [Deltaproteobacteria bacterium]|nr:MAG: hypothetical protein EP343_17755 [Deltaproteobacteria bacterium]
MGATDSHDNPNSPRPQLEWENRLGRYLVMAILGLVGGSFTLAILLSIYNSISAPPQVWGVPPSPKRAAPLMSRQRLRVCRQHLERLSNEQYRETTSLWYRMRNGHRGHLTLWQEWSRDWQRRMKNLLKRCPMRNKATAQKTSNNPLSLSSCTEKFQALNTQLQQKGRVLWEKARPGANSYLQGWKDWSGSWYRRMQQWRQRCPVFGEGETARAFHRAHHQMLVLQRKQEKALLAFFQKSSDLFRDIRQALHSLKEELR